MSNFHYSVGINSYIKLKDRNLVFKVINVKYKTDLIIEVIYFDYINNQNVMLLCIKEFILPFEESTFKEYIKCLFAHYQRKTIEPNKEHIRQINIRNYNNSTQPYNRLEYNLKTDIMNFIRINGETDFQVKLIIETLNEIGVYET
jgi:hypothetical protein